MHTDTIPQDCAELIFQNDDFYAFNKRSGVAVIPGRGCAATGSLLEQIECATGEKMYVVHRIDRATSGIVIFARTRFGHRVLCRQFEARTVKKRYRAVVAGEVRSDGVIDKPLYQFGSGRMGIDSRGKASKTRYSVVETCGEWSVLLVEPETGRRHQIRVHLCDAGHPIAGDPLYGSDRPVGGVGRLMLHAEAISFIDTTGRNVSLTAPTDENWAALIGTLCRGTIQVR